MLLRKIFIIIIALSLYLPNLCAQSNNQQIDSVKVKDIMYLLKVSGTSDFAYLIIDDVIRNYQQYITTTPPGYWDKIVQETDIRPFMRSLVPVYDKRFSHEEIKDLIKFFESSTGSKWAAQLKEMNDEVMEQANKYGQGLFEEINNRLIKEGYINQQGTTEPAQNEDKPQEQQKK
jgi:hypothetical protein